MRGKQAVKYCSIELEVRIIKKKMKLVVVSDKTMEDLLCLSKSLDFILGVMGSQCRVQEKNRPRTA